MPWERRALPGLNKPGELNDYFIFRREGSATDHTEPKRIAGGLLVLGAAFAALYFDNPFQLPFNNLSGFIKPGFHSSQRLRTPGTEIVGVEISFGQREQAAAAEVCFFFREVQVNQHLGPKCQQNAPCLSSVEFLNGSLLAQLYLFILYLEFCFALSRSRPGKNELWNFAQWLIIYRFPGRILGIGE